MYQGITLLLAASLVVTALIVFKNQNKAFDIFMKLLALPLKGLDHTIDIFYNVVPIMVVERSSVLEASLRLVAQSLTILPYLGR